MRLRLRKSSVPAWKFSHLELVKHRQFFMIIDLYVYKKMTLFVIIPPNEMKFFNWLIRIQNLECYCLANLPKHNFRFYNNQLERKITKENNRITPRKHNIIRCCTSRRKSCCRYCTFERRSRCSETFALHECLNPGANHVYNVWIVNGHG